jgi:hypothetical protein
MKTNNNLLNLSIGIYILGLSLIFALTLPLIQYNQKMVLFSPISFISFLFLGMSPYILKIKANRNKLQIIFFSISLILSGYYQCSQRNCESQFLPIFIPISLLILTSIFWGITEIIKSIKKTK